MQSCCLRAAVPPPCKQDDEPVEPSFSADRLLDDDVTYLADEIWDPWEGFNRTMYRFNYRFDKYVFLPVVSGYQAITPDFMEQGIHNFFQNFGELTSLMNSILQLQPTKTVETTGRFLVNTTVGLLGLFDVASKLDIPKHDEDFGQTLGYWGVGNGPFLVLPVMGPSNVRDGLGLGVDWFVRNEIREEGLGMKTSEVTGLEYRCIQSIPGRMSRSVTSRPVHRLNTNGSGCCIPRSAEWTSRDRSWPI